MNKSVLLVLSVLFFTEIALAQSPREWTNYTDVNDVNAITSKGDTLWLATSGGLVRLLQSDLTNEVRLTNADGLGDNELRFVTIDSNGVLWCGGENGRLSRRRNDKSWAVFSFEDEDGLPIRLNAATPGPDGFLWVASDVGVHKFDTHRNGGEIKESYTRIGDWPDEAAANDVAVTDLFVWVVGDAGLARARINDPFLLDRTHWRTASSDLLTSLVVTYTFGSRTVLYVGGTTGLLRVSADSLWAITRDALNPTFDYIRDLTLCKSSNKDTLWIAFDAGPGVLRSGVVRLDVPGAVPAGFTSVHCTDQAVYFGQTNGGVWRLKDEEWTHIKLGGPLDNNLVDIAVAEDGHVWTAHPSSGASMFANGEWSTIPYVIAHPGAPAQAVDIAPDGFVWFGIWGAGVWRVDPQDPLNPAAAVNYRQPNSSLMWVKNADSPNDYEYVVITDAVVDAQGRVWCANFRADSGAVIGWNDHGCWGRFDANDGLTSDEPSVIYPFDSSILVGFNNNGIVEINFREPLCAGGQPINQVPRLRQHTTAQGLPSDQITALLYDKSDSLWVGTNLGLAHYSPDRHPFDYFKVDLPPEAGLTINTLAVDANNGIWIGTTAGLVIREADGTMTFYNSQNSGLVGDNVSEIEMDQKTGEVWIATRSGVSRTRGPLPTTASVENTVAYPNPFNIGEADRVRFNAPSGSRIVITTVSGHQVTNVNPDIGWDGRNSSGELVATGVYLFVVRSPIGDFGHGKIAVIRR